MKDKKKAILGIICFLAVGGVFVAGKKIKGRA